MGGSHTWDECYDYGEKDGHETVSRQCFILLAVKREIKLSGESNEKSMSVSVARDPCELFVCRL